MRNFVNAAIICMLVLAVASKADLSSSGNGPQPLPSSLAVTALSAAATTVTATLPLVSGQFHYITGIQIVRTCATALVGSAVLAVTTTNLPGSLAFTGGNACAVGSTNVDFSMSFASPLKSSVAGTATTLVAPSGGAAVQYRLTVFYYAAP
jgi:hypothetical protein